MPTAVLLLLLRWCVYMCVCVSLTAACASLCAGLLLQPAAHARAERQAGWCNVGGTVDEHSTLPAALLSRWSESTNALGGNSIRQQLRPDGERQGAATTRVCAVARATTLRVWCGAVVRAACGRQLLCCGRRARYGRFAVMCSPLLLWRCMPQQQGQPPDHVTPAARSRSWRATSCAPACARCTPPRAIDTISKTLRRAWRPPLALDDTQ